MQSLGAWRSAGLDAADRELSETDAGQPFTVDHHGETVRRVHDAAGRAATWSRTPSAPSPPARPWASTADEIRPALAAYGGVKRRFERVGEANGVLVMDDYAHHPTEIEALAAAASARFPGRRIVAMFQPHTYARSRYLLDGFKRCFAGFDRLFILETYAAREAIADGMTGAQLAAELHDPEPATPRPSRQGADMRRRRPASRATCSSRSAPVTSTPSARWCWSASRRAARFDHAMRS